MKLILPLGISFYTFQCPILTGCILERDTAEKKSFFVMPLFIFISAVILRRRN